MSEQPSAPPIPPRYGVRQTLRRGTVAVGQLIGGYFGVTEEGSNAWGEMSQRRVEESQGFGLGTLSRRRVSSPGPPDYNTLEMGERGLHGQYQSFDPDDFSSDSSDEEVFSSPPGYNSVSGRGPSAADQRISMFGPEDPERVQCPRPVERLPRGEEDQDTAATITDPEEGVRYYSNYMRAEKRIKQRRGRQAASEFFGEGRNSSTSSDGSVGFRGRLNSVVSNPSDRRRSVAVNLRGIGRTKLERQNTMVREELQSLPTFWPIFIVGVTVVQAIVLVVLIPLQGLAPIDYQPETHKDSYPSLLNTSGNTSVTYYRFTNLWIGIGLLDLIHSGVKFTPCMRKDAAIINRNIQQRNREKQDDGGLGCCQNRIWVGTVVEDECVTNDNPNFNDSQFDNSPCKDSTQLVANFHPCCISITGQCRVMHVRECLDRGGVFHSDKDSCNDTNCIDSICGLNGVGEENGDPLRPSGSQIWRLVLSLFIHLGVLHIAVVGIIQLYLGIKIEYTVGFIRVALIYIISGVGGNLLSAIFIPYQVNGGASPAVFGLLSVVFVELFQFWQLVDHAWLEVVKLSSIFIFLLAFGTLPFIDNLANLGGFIFGIPSAIIFLPYITFGKVDAWRKRILLIICIPLLLLMFAVGFIVFYLVPDTDFCQGCHYFNCIPFTPSFCQNEVSDPNPEIFAL